MNFADTIVPMKLQNPHASPQSGELPQRKRQLPSYHVVPADGGWAVQSRGSVHGVHPTKMQAVDAARELARTQGADVVVSGGLGRMTLSTSPADDLMLELWKRTRAGKRSHGRMR